MKLFFDSNVWIAAFASRGFCNELLEVVLSEGNSHSLCTGPVVIDEVFRILDAKFVLSESARMRANRILATAELAHGGTWSPPPEFPDPSDAPILAAALAARADWFVTGDQALLALELVETLPILSPREAYKRLRGLA